MQGSPLDTINDLVMDTIGCVIMLFFLALILRKKTLADIIPKMGLDKKMTVIGKKWDATCTPDVEEGSSIKVGECKK